MKLAHLSDLHLGKVVCGYSMLEDQREILHQIEEKLIRKGVDTVVIAGDVYDRTVPPAEAVTLLNVFLSALKRENMNIFLIAGNHDSGERLSFAGDLLDEVNVHISGVWNGKLTCTDLMDRLGPYHVWSLPYLRPSAVNRFIEDESKKVSTYEEAVKYALSTADLNPEERNILVAHQFVAGASLEEDGSEEFAVGGLDCIDSSVFDGFDYVALGHIHTSQAAGSQTVRYCGTPLAYSFGEKNEKSITLVDLEEKGQMRISLIHLTPKRPFAVLEGMFADLLKPEMIEKHQQEYLSIILDDPQDVPDAITTLGAHYPYIMKLDYASRSVKGEEALQAAEEMEKKTPYDLFAEFYEQRNQQEMSEEQKEYVQKEINEIWKGEQA